MPAINLLQYDEETQEGIAEIESPMDEATLEPQVPIRVFCHPFSLPEANHKISLFGVLVTNIVSENAVQAHPGPDYKLYWSNQTGTIAQTGLQPAFSNLTTRTFVL